MKYLFTIQIFIVSFSLAAQEAGDLHLKLKLGAFLNTQKEFTGDMHSVHLDVSKKWRGEFNFYGTGKYLRLQLFGSSYTGNYTYINDLGASYCYKSFQVKKMPTKLWFGAGVSQQRFVEYSNVVFLQTGFFSDEFWFDRKYTVAQGIYVKPQLQFQLDKKISIDAFAYANFNGYKNVYSIGLSTNIIGFRYFKGAKKN
jgi:hypothetical protein